jgi:alanine-glyoxylate transaminase / serine-glyoxylate transaminase / serine-pyruvate transaminase
MTIKNGRELLAMPGPTTVPDAVLAAMHRPAIDIYAGELLDLTDQCLDNLRTVFRTRGRTYIYAANGHGAWEGGLANVLSRGDEILVLESGRFAINWGGMARTMGITVHGLDGTFRSAVDPQRVEERLREDTAGNIKAVLIVQVDTASGVVNDIPAIRAAMDASGHDALLMVDTIASLATMPFEMDEWRVDVAISGSQKGLMCPPGLSFCAAGERAIEARKSADLASQYWDWNEREGAQHYQKYCGTPPEHMLFGLGKALEMILAEGLDNVFTRHRLLARAVQTAVGTWSQGGGFEFNVLEPAERAGSVTTIAMRGDFSSAPIADFCRDTCGVTLGLGIGGLNGFRIAHMGHINAPMILGTLGSVELALRSLGVPHGEGGVTAAIESLAEDLETLK